MVATLFRKSLTEANFRWCIVIIEMKRQGPRSQKRSRAPPITAGGTEQGARVSTPEARPHHGHDTVLPITPVSDNVRGYDEQLAFVPPHATTGGGYDATSRSTPEDYHRRRRSRGCMCTVSTFCFVGGRDARRTHGHFPASLHQDQPVRQCDNGRSRTADC
ncbi:hypothetical protein MRX96_042605 [Rhipicephalus microplus]